MSFNFPAFATEARDPGRDLPEPPLYARVPVATLERWRDTLGECKLDLLEYDGRSVVAEKSLLASREIGSAIDNATGSIRLGDLAAELDIDLDAVMDALESAAAPRRVRYWHQGRELREGYLGVIALRSTIGSDTAGEVEADVPPGVLEQVRGEVERE